MRRDGAAAALLVALRAGDDVALARLIDVEARLTIDTGDSGGGSVRGRARVIRTLARLLVGRADAGLEPAEVNGCPGLALRRDDGTVTGVLALEIEGGAGTVSGDGGGAAIVELWLQASPAKLERWNRRRPVPGRPVTDRGPARSE
ncbi:hypothetical protein GCM10017608_18100 [Agromyces luteolus]|uniref:Uncharacterized protein n=1 Tax=Agromyces luteolus TaxID=88373 RepID=A0A7C9HIV1_9MICO|nr:hypothetical protein [Agromyces luteolus]MUN08108.1 hypothetical protein [Agromyces luteolus]GLK27876.1 hypothetical protein GCM10017608_18100 [Agromyces luteolus]